MAVVIEGAAKGPTNEKRFYLPGVIVKAECPICASLVEEDLGKEYISYPHYGVPFDLKCWCGECADVSPNYEGFCVRVQIQCTLVLVTDPTP